MKKIDISRIRERLFLDKLQKLAPSVLIGFNDT